MEEYKDLFLAEAQEYLQTMTECLLKLEKNPADSEQLTEMFRAAHSLKGMAGTMGYELIMELTHDLENMLDYLRSGDIEVGKELVNLLFEAEDMIQLLLENLENQEDYRTQVEALKDKLKNWEELSGGRREIPLASSSFPGGQRAEFAGGEQEKAAPAGVQDMDIFKELNEFEKETLKEAVSQGEKIYQVHVRLREGSLLKSVRAYMVVKVVEKQGEIIKALPSLQELEEENFDLDFSLLLVGKPNVDEVRAAIEGISEVERVNITPLDISGEPGLLGAFSAGGISPADKESFPEEDALKGAAPSQPVPAAAVAVKELEKEEEEQKTPFSLDQKKIKATPSFSRTADKTVRVETAKLDSLVNLVGELIINRTRVVELGKKFEDELLDNSLEQLERITTDLQNAVMTLRMIPIKQVFDRFPRMVRDLAVERGKEVELIISGEETELDRTIVNQIGDPLVHLLRNAVDHGIEKVEERKRLGKDPVGKIFLEAHHEGSHVVVSVEDDGSGIDGEALKKKALQEKLITPEEAEKMTSEEAIRLIFRSGFSTAEEVTDLSGRGVGMDVVKTSIEALNGTVEVKSEPGKGSKFILRLPLTLAIIRTLMVGAGGEIYAIPIEAIRENLYVEPKEIKTIQRQKVITLREEVLPLYSLLESLKMGRFEEREIYPVVVVQAGEKKAGLIVDELIGQQEVVIKSLSSFIKDIKGVAGATVLGDGRVTLILDIAGLLEDGRVNVGKESAHHR